VGRNRFRKRRSAIRSVASAMQLKIFTLTSASCKDLTARYKSVILLFLYMFLS
jgi:hypothetical protein